jgi:hypothetical protein
MDYVLDLVSHNFQEMPSNFENIHSLLYANITVH